MASIPSILFLLAIFVRVNSNALQLDDGFPIVLGSKAAQKLLLSACPLEAVPVEIIKQATEFDIFLSEKFGKDIGKSCGNGSDSLYAYADDSSKLEVQFLNITTESRVQVPADIEFESKDNAYQSFSIETSSLDDGLHAEILLEYGEAKVFLSACADYEGAVVGDIAFPKKLDINLNAMSLVKLIDDVACPGQSALYQDFEKQKPQVIIRLRSANAKGLILARSLPKSAVPTVLEVPKYGALTKTMVPGYRVKLAANSTAMLEAQLGEEVNFEVMSGLVEVVFGDCDEASPEEISAGEFNVGEYTITAKQIACNSTSTVTLIFFALEDSELLLIKDTNGLYIVIAILIISTVLILILAVISWFYCRPQRKTVCLKTDIEMKPTGIPINSSWM